MNHDRETALWKVLDTMERTHKRIFAVGWLSVAATLAAYIRIGIEHQDRYGERYVPGSLTKPVTGRR